MPKKIRELKEMLRKAGFAGKSGKGSHSKWTHSKAKKPVVLSGKDGDDAKVYQERNVEQAVAQVQKPR